MKSNTHLTILGIAVLAALTAGPLLAQTDYGPPEGRPGFGKRGGPRTLLRFAEQLELTAEQQDEIGVLEESLREAVQPLREKARERIQELHQGSDAPRARGAFRDDPELQSIRSEMHALRQAFKEEVGEILTEEQKQELRELIREGRQCAGRGGRGRGGARL
jgi:Spy/CpxP family protein refolding chaperone